MSQSLIQLPETADIVLFGTRIMIRAHKFASGGDLFAAIIDVIKSPKSDRHALSQFEKHGSVLRV